MIQTTIGNYKLLRPLGEGGMGVVYQAEHVVMGRRAAVKILRRELVRDEQAIRRFFNEARATNEIRHPGIVQIYDCGTTDDGAPWLIMELLDGETLAARVRRLGRTTPGDVVELGGQTASVLAAAHAAGIVHRDLKPDNIFVVPDPDVAGGERIKVLDFGIAKLGAAMNPVAAFQTRTGVVMGTPVYMSPEQCRGTKQIDARSDIYSLGLILYEMLAGAPPFLSEGIGELFDLHMNVAPRPLEDLNPTVGIALARTIHRTLEKDPARRFQTMGDLQQALAAAGGATKESMGRTGPAPERRPSSAPGAAAADVAQTSISGQTRLMPALKTTLSASTTEIAEAPARPRSRAWVAALGAVVLLGVGVAVAARHQDHDRAMANPSPAPVAPKTQAMTTGAAPVPAAAPIAPAAPVAPEAPLAGIAIEIATTPIGARVVEVESGAPLGTTPMREHRPRGSGELKVRIERKGYLSKNIAIPLDHDFKKTLKLERVPSVPDRQGDEEHIIKL